LKVDEIIWVSKNLEKRKLERGKTFQIFPYTEQRKVLNYIVDCLYEDNRERFYSREQVMELFIRSHFDGNLVKIGKLIDKSFGEGVFRTIGMMESSPNSANLMMHNLELFRARMRSKKLTKPKENE